MPEEPEDESTEARFRRVQEELRAMELPDMPDEEVEARLDAMTSSSRASMPDVPMSEDILRDLETRASKARTVHQKAKGGEPSRIESDRRASKGLGIGLAMAYTMIGLPLVGALVGFLLNRVFPGPWIAVGVVVGFVAGVAFALFLGNRERDNL